ncbi:MAG TPA: hypothetical protein PKL84_13970, partial [Candidatus Hydrogenedentes bacterium]|nr:hypothetical protein [Candidatus Hydrogenedentota bacterium]
GDNRIDLVEVLRIIQFYNAGGLYCARPPHATEDGYVAGPGLDTACTPHSADYEPPGGDWSISLSELLRVVQLYQASGYEYCPDAGTDDGFCPIVVSM